MSEFSNQPRLFESLQVQQLILKNRIAMSPVCQYSAQDGFPTNWHFVHWGTRVVGGVGLLMVEATAVTAQGRITPGCLGLWSQEQSERFKPAVDFAHDQGAAMGIQLAHAGRKGSCERPWTGGKPLGPSQRWSLVAPSALAFTSESVIPESLSIHELRTVARDFTNSAQLAIQAGFDVLELHMAHGYLLHEFLSPLTNVRTDSYGGSLENRMRFPLEVALRVREVWPADKPLFVRLSVTDWVEGGWDLEQSVIFANELKKCGVDLIDCSSGGLLSYVKVPQEEGLQVPFAMVIRARAGIKTGAVGNSTSPTMAENIIKDGQADLIFLGRELLRNPYWVFTAAQELGATILAPPQYDLT